MSQDVPASGLWALALINSAVFILFAFSFFKPKTRRDWWVFGSFSAFIVALFVEVYGFPLTTYLLSGWLTRRFPGIDPRGHDVGHLWYMLLGFRGNAHLNPIHIASNVIIVAGFLLLAAARRDLYGAWGWDRLAMRGLYAHVRHPQYVALLAIMFGFLLQWPTFVTLAMFPVLVTMYVWLAHREEHEVRARFGFAWDQYASRVPAFVPRLRRGRIEVDSHA